MVKDQYPDFPHIWERMKGLARDTSQSYPTIGGRTSFTIRLTGDTIEIDSIDAKSLNHINRESAKKNYEIFLSLPESERYKTTNYYETWNKVYFLALLKCILEE